MQRLQKMLLASTLVCSDVVLNLPRLTVEDVRYHLNKSEQALLYDMMTKYELAWKEHKDFQRYDSVRTADEKDICVLGYLIRAQQESVHPTLKNARSESYNDIIGRNTADFIANITPTPRAEKWLAEMKQTDVAKSSSFIKAFMKLYQKVVKDYSKECLIVFSKKTAVLDLIGVAFNQAGKGISHVFYNGRMSIDSREQSLKSFRSSAPGTNVLLMTPGYGGTGLNLPEASLIIQSEIWWNSNVERQS